MFVILIKESVRKKTPSSPTSEPHRGIFSQRSSSPAPSPLQNRRTVSSDASSSRVENGLQLSQSVPDLRYGVKHVRSSSQPSKSAASTPHRESFSSVTFPDRSNSVNSEGSYYNEVADAPMILQEDIIALTVHVRTFSEALSSLRNTFIECEGTVKLKALFTTEIGCLADMFSVNFLYTREFNMKLNKRYKNCSVI